MGQPLEEVNDTLIARDGLKLFYWQYKPAAERARLVIAHGVGEHSGRYRNVVDTLTPHGFGVWGIDHRGHGRSEGSRGHIMSFSDYVEDLRVFIELVRADMADGQKLFLLGHSMGGLVAIHCALHYGAMIDGLIVSSPSLGMKISIPWLTKQLGLFMSRIYPRMTLGNGLDPAKLSHDPHVIKVYMEDILVHDRVSARWFTEFITAMNNSHDQASTLAVPILMQVAGDDYLVNALSSEAFFRALDVKDKTIHVYDGLYHEVYNEKVPDRFTVLSDLKDWLEGHIAS